MYDCHKGMLSSLGRFIYILDIQIIVHSHFDLFSSLLALEATELVSEQVT
jgi:hypothetical protein